MATANKTEASADRTLVITRVFNAPRHLVYEAWTKKEHLDKWNAPKDFTIPFSDAELRPGGAIRCTMIAPDGTEHKMCGTYREIVPNELLVFTHGWEEDSGEMDQETLVTVRFADEAGGRTRMTFEQTNFKSVESRDNHNEGWTECFDKLAEILTTEKS